MAEIHPTAVIDSEAKIGENVSIGPYCCIGGKVEIGNGVELKAHVVIDGQTSIGADSKFFPFASIGLPPQDLKYSGEESTLTIGERNIVREYVTMNPGTEGGGLETKVGNDNLFMVGAHVAHDCIVGIHVIRSNNSTFAGHETVCDYAIIRGLAAVHQLCLVGRRSMIGGMAGGEAE